MSLSGLKLVWSSILLYTRFPVDHCSDLLQNRSKADVVKDDDMDDNDFEALFKQLKEDFKRDEESLNESED